MWFLEGAFVSSVVSFFLSFGPKGRSSYSILGLLGFVFVWVFVCLFLLSLILTGFVMMSLFTGIGLAYRTRTKKLNTALPK